MHSGDLSELSAVNLSDVEREALLQVMQRAKQFDQQSTLSGPLEGQLYKWTNPLKGWQPRWFHVDQQQGVLHYYTSEERRKHPPRGSLHLWGAVVAPSEEDSQTFSVNGANGEIYKLRAVDAKERQYWVSRLRNEVEHCTNQSFGTPVKETLKLPSSSSAPSTPQSLRVGGGGGEKGDASASTSPHLATPTRTLSKRLRDLSKSKLTRKSPSREGKTTSLAHPQDQDDASQLPGGDAMLEVLTRLQCYQESLVAQLESSATQAGIEPTDKSVLMLKATAQAALHSVKDCLALMKLQQTQGSSDVPQVASAPSSTTASISSPTDPASVDKKLKMPRPLSTPNLDEPLIDLSSDSLSQTESVGRTPKRAMTTTAV